MRSSSEIIQLYYHILNKKLSVRQAETLAKKYQQKTQPTKIIIPQKINTFHSQLEKYLKTNVKINIKSNKSGTIKINFLTLKELKLLIKKIIE